MMLQNTFRCALLRASTSCMRQVSKASTDCPKIAVVLSGCGHLDGAEIHESVSVLSHLTRNKAIPHVYALDCKQYHVIDHSKGEEDSSHCRNILSEASRIARHPVQPLNKLIEDFKCYRAVIFPGGFGVAKNFSDFVTKGPEMEVHPQVKQVLQCFHEEKKPIGLICIAPILAAKLFIGVRITLGKIEEDKWPFRDAITAAQRMGAIMEMKGVDEVSADYDNMVFSTPAYMYDGEYHEIDDGVGKLVLCILATLSYVKKN